MPSFDPHSSREPKPDLTLPNIWRVKSDRRKVQLLLSLFVERVFASCRNTEERFKAAAPLIDELHQREDSWRTNYLSEQLQTGIHPPDKVMLEIRRRLVDGRELGIKGIPLYEQDLASIEESLPDPPVGNPEALHARAFHTLLRLVNDVQWGYVKRYVKSDLVRKYRQKVYGFFLAAFFIFLATLIFRLRDAPLVPSIEWEGASGFWLAIVSGLFGATFSMLTSLQRRVVPATIDDMEAMNERFNMLLRLSFGAGAGMILYFIFQADLLQGILFPDIEHLGLSPVEIRTGNDAQGQPARINGFALGALVPNRDTAALIVWCFIAGFSETFVPTLLDRIEKSGGEKSSGT